MIPATPSSLVDSACRGDVASLTLLLQRGAHANGTGADGRTPLIWASMLGRAEAVSVLHQHGAVVDMQDRAGWTALMWASYMGHKVLATFLISCGAALDLQNLDGTSPQATAPHTDTPTRSHAPHTRARHPACVWCAAFLAHTCVSARVGVCR